MTKKDLYPKFMEQCEELEMNTLVDILFNYFDTDQLIDLSDYLYGETGNTSIRENVNESEDAFEFDVDDILTWVGEEYTYENVMDVIEALENNGIAKKDLKVRGIGTGPKVKQWRQGVDMSQDQFQNKVYHKVHDIVETIYDEPKLVNLTKRQIRGIVWGVVMSISN